MPNHFYLVKKIGVDASMVLITKKSLDDYKREDKVPITRVSADGEIKDEKPTKARIMEAIEEIDPMTKLHQIDFCTQTRARLEEAAREKIKKVYQIMEISGAI